MAVNKVKLSIGGTEYSILAEDDVKYVQEQENLREEPVGSAMVPDV